jgi:hypothetical protein
VDPCKFKLDQLIAAAPAAAPAIAAKLLRRLLLLLLPQALHESLLEVLSVFDDCAKHGLIRSMINAGGVGGHQLGTSSITSQCHGASMACMCCPVLCRWLDP